MTDSTTSGRVYVAIWGWLIGLVLLSVLLSERAVPSKIIVLIVLALSTIKAVLVALYYMHLQSDRRLLAFILLAPFILLSLVFGVVWSSQFVRL